MNRTIALIAAVVVVIVGGAAAWWFSQGTEEPTVGATAPPVETTAASEATEDTMESSDTTEAPATTADGSVTYALTDAASATFTIDEELRGNPVTVVGVSSIVLGEIVVDPANPSSLQIGTVLVNARDFTTDSGNRNRAVRGPILDADNFENIAFTPTSIDGLPSEAVDSLAFTVTGDLTIKETTAPVTFEVTLDVSNPDTVTGTAEATVDRTVWGLNIPSAPGVANVSEEVGLFLDIVAAPTA